MRSLILTLLLVFLLSSPIPALARALYQGPADPPNRARVLEKLLAAIDKTDGPSEVKWKLSAGKFKLDIEIPANVIATVWLPQGNPAKLREGGHPLKQVDGVKLSRVENGRPVLEVASGKYSFTLE